MGAGIYNFEIDQGGTFSRIFTYKTSASVAVDITGYIARMSIRKSWDSANALLTLDALTTTSLTRKRASDISTITTANIHSLSVGDTVTVSSMGGTGYDGTQTVTVVGAVNSFSFSEDADDESIQSDTSGSIVKATASGGITLGGSAGTITVSITSAQSAALSFDTAVYNLEIVAPTTFAVTQLLKGRITLVKEATK